VVFFDISNAFDKVWHKGLLSKLKHAGISGSFLSWFNSYLTDRKQGVILPGPTHHVLVSKQESLKALYLIPYYCFIFINDIVNEIESFINLFADDTDLYVIVEHPNTIATLLQSDIQKISLWTERW
jgi:hypothetical protein